MNPDRPPGSFRLVDDVPEAFAEMVVDRVAAGARSLFLSGGDTARDCYRVLATLTGTGGPTPLDWTGIDVYLGDERCVPPDDPDSNHRMIVETLLDQVGPVGSDHPMYRAGSPEAAADAYQAEVAALAAFDLVHLGLGPDGHTASLFPTSAALDVADPERLVVANTDPLGHNPHPRLTLTYAGIARGRLVVFTVAGEDKQDPLARIVGGEDLPAARATGDEVVWLVDRAAAGTLDLPR